MQERTVIACPICHMAVDRCDTCGEPIGTEPWVSQWNARHGHEHLHPHCLTTVRASVADAEAPG